MKVVQLANIGLCGRDKKDKFVIQHESECNAMISQYTMYDFQNYAAIELLKNLPIRKLRKAAKMTMNNENP